MTFLSNLTTISEKKRKRVGRGYGSGVGAKSRRGTTRHQSAREKIKIEYEGGQNKMTKKFPLLRGKMRNKSIQGKAKVISVDKLNVLPAKSEVTLKTLLDAKMLNVKNGWVKIVGGGTLKHPLTVKVETTEKAREEIEKAGGSVSE